MNAWRRHTALLAFLVLACSPKPKALPSDATTPRLIANGELVHLSPGNGAFTATDLARWGLGSGQWTWVVAGEKQYVAFHVDGSELVLTSHYGTFRGGTVENGSILVLAEPDEGMGPPSTTWINIARVADGELKVAIQMVGGAMSEPIRTRLLRD